MGLLTLNSYVAFYIKKKEKVKKNPRTLNKRVNGEIKHTKV